MAETGKLVVARHGQKDPEYKGPDSVHPLSKLGRKQAEQVGSVLLPRVLSPEEIENAIFVSSDLTRAVSTGEEAAAAQGLMHLILQFVELGEYSRGADGAGNHTLEMVDDKIGGTTPRRIATRALGVLAKLGLGKRTIVVFSHSGIKMPLRAIAIGADADPDTKQQLSHAPAGGVDVLTYVPGDDNAPPHFNRLTTLHVGSNDEVVNFGPIPVHLQIPTAS